MIIDSHCHLDRLVLKDHHDSLKETLQTAWDADVSRILTVCISLETFPKVLEITKRYSDKLNCSVGLHPSEKVASEPEVSDIAQLAQDDLVIAIGETGLDYYYDFVDQEIQRARFRTHIQAAKEVNKPIIVHTRESNQDLIAILKEEGARDVGAVMHCFTEDWALAKQALDLGFYISFSGIITFKNADQIREVAQKTPLDRILVETDAPYLAPAPMRGKSNEPAYVRYTAEFIADLLKMRFDKFAEQTSQNYYRLFGRMA